MLSCENPDVYHILDSDERLVATLSGALENPVFYFLRSAVSTDIFSHHKLSASKYG